LADLNIKVVKDVESLSKCGGFEFQVQWQVDDAPNGWVIQHVIFSSDVHRCAGPRIDAPNEEYWEAWRVDAGVVHIGNGPNLHHADTFRVPGYGNGTRGFTLIKGKVKFMESYKLVIGPGGPWREGQVAAAGALPTTRTAPAGWDESDALDHSAEARWNCCGGKEAFVTAVGRVVTAEFHDDGQHGSSPDGNGQGRRMGEGVAKTVGELRSMPAWSELPAGDRKGLDTVMRRLQQLSKQRDATLRAAFSAYLDEERKAGGPSVAAMSRLFLANRYLFAVPAELPLGSMPFFGGWLGVPMNEETVNPLWPFATSKSGKLSLTGQFQGYTGDDYLAVAEFDRFRTQFGRRK
jgi:hypothetical protein